MRNLLEYAAFAAAIAACMFVILDTLQTERRYKLEHVYAVERANWEKCDCILDEDD